MAFTNMIPVADTLVQGYGRKSSDGTFYADDKFSSGKSSRKVTGINTLTRLYNGIEQFRTGLNSTNVHPNHTGLFIQTIGGTCFDKGEAQYDANYIPIEVNAFRMIPGHMSIAAPYLPYDGSSTLTYPYINTLEIPITTFRIRRRYQGTGLPDSTLWQNVTGRTNNASYTMVVNASQNITAAANTLRFDEPVVVCESYGSTVWYVVDFDFVFRYDTWIGYEDTGSAYTPTDLLPRVTFPAI